VLKRRLKQRLLDSSGVPGRVNVAKRINKAASVNVGGPGGKQFSRISQRVRVRQDESGTHEEVHTEEVIQD
jgi:hypothetical protein